MNNEEAYERLEQEFGSRLGMLGHQIVMLSMTGQHCDLTFHDRKPLLDVTIDPQINLALLYGAGSKRLHEMLESIKLSDGSVVSLTELWTVLPLPKGGFKDEQLLDVDLADAEEKAGPNGETIRQMVSETYHCENREEEDHFLRRYLAS